MLNYFLEGSEFQSLNSGLNLSRATFFLEGYPFEYLFPQTNSSAMLLLFDW